MTVLCFTCPHFEHWDRKPRDEINPARAEEIGLMPNESVYMVKCNKARGLLQVFERWLTDDDDGPTCHYFLFKNAEHKSMIWLKDLWDAELVNLETLYELLEEMDRADDISAIEFLRYFIKVWYKWKKNRKSLSSIQPAP